MICAHFHWTLDYLENGISWAKAIRLMADLPVYDTDLEEKTSGTKKQDFSTEITEQNAEDIMKQFQM